MLLRRHATKLMSHLDYYEVLEVSPRASVGVIEAAYRRLARDHHPDVGGSHERMRSLNEAFALLQDPARRAEYDRRRGVPSATARSRTGHSSPPAPEPVRAANDSTSPAVGTVWVNPTDGAEMVWVPGGSFPMGSEDGHLDERPAHRVEISQGFWLYRTAVTNAQYERFFKATDHMPPEEPWWGRRRENLPVVNVSWSDARAYCEWAGARLPTEAEWEYAARGEDGKKYPWGNRFPDSSRAVFGTVCPDAVGSLPRGASWCGALDLAGNVWEWCEDWYSSDYYKVSPTIDPSGPETGLLKVLRGGSWSRNLDFLRAATRRGFDPALQTSFLGFRPARNVF